MSDAFFFTIVLIDGGRRGEGGCGCTQSLTNRKLFYLAHLNRLVGSDEGQHEVEPRAAGSGQESPSPEGHTHTHTVHHSNLDINSINDKTPKLW